MDTSPLTELKAVNIMLRIDGEAPVSTLDDTGFSEVADALATLEEISREEQTRGWAFNTDYERQFSPDAMSGHIELPDDVLWIRPSHYSIGLDIVERDRKLYNLRTNSYVFTQPVWLDVCYFLPFDSLPSYARNLIAIRAGRRYQKNATGSARQDMFTKEDEDDAKAEMKKADQRARRRGHFRSPKGASTITRRPL
ncbi:hypothetical protein ACQKH5_07170 [Hyphomonas sp. NPDC076900]|uniref:hypothetical protein n=1 Tax=Hyphomonas sp. NPDC076900 TaxID=3390570 RepID=UPI003CFD4FAB